MQAHRKARAEVDESNKKRVLDKNGDYVTTMSFQEAFEHHVHFVFCRAKGTFPARLGGKAEFIEYVRGTPSSTQPCNQPCTPFSP